MQREEFLDIHASRLASIIYSTCVLNTTNGNWSVRLENIKGYLCDEDILNDEELHKMIENKLWDYEGVLDLKREGTEYDLIIGLAYFNYGDEEEE